MNILTQKQIIKIIKDSMKEVVRNAGGKRAIDKMWQVDLEELTPSEAFDLGQYRAYEMLLSDLNEDK